MKNLNVYIGFDGQCREALNYYKECFGGELQIMTVGEGPQCDEMPNMSPDAVMHGCLFSDKLMLMAADMGTLTAKGSRDFSMAIGCESEEELHSLFNKLADGGQVFQPVGDAFWGGKFGMATDRFGVSWMLTYTDEGCV